MGKEEAIIDAECLEVVTVVKDVANIFFFAAVTVLTGATYLQAKKSFFNPIRTEAFKLQIKALEATLEHFQGKTEYDFLEEGDFRTIKLWNIGRMIEEYNSACFQCELAEEWQFGCGQNVLSHYQIAPELEDQLDYQNFAASYRHRTVIYSQKHAQWVEQRHRLLNSPLLPLELRKLILDFDNLVFRNVKLFSEVLTNGAPEFCTRYPTESDFIAAVTAESNQFGWLMRQYENEVQPLLPAASAVVCWIRDYLEIDMLKNPNWWKKK